MAVVEVPQTLEYRGGQLNAAHVLEVENFTNWKKRFMCHILDDQMNSFINCLTVKSTWDDLILYHEGPFDVKESRVMDLKLCYNTFKFKEGDTLTQTFTRYKALMNELVNDGIKLSKLEINTGFINGLPKKWLSFCQSLKNTNHVKDFELASLFGKLKYEENLIDSIYESEKNKSLVSATPLSTAFIFTSIVQDFQDSPNDEEDTRSNEEEVSSDDNEIVEVKILMALAKENDAVSKEVARNGEWVKISMRKDTGRILLAESQRNTIDHLVVVTDSLAIEYDSADESSVCSTPLPPLKKLDGAEPIFGSKTNKSILRLKSTFKAETLKGVKINEPSSASAKVNSALAGKLMIVKIKGDPPLAIVIKEHNDLRLQIIKNKIISLEREINPRNPQHAFKRCEAYGSSTHTTTDHYDIEWFKRGEALQAKKAEALKSTMAESSNANRSKTPIRRRDSKHMTGVKSNLHKYEEQPGPKVVFRDDSTCVTEGYGSIKCNGIVFTKVAFVNGLKYNLISISQLCDAKYIVQFDEKRGTIFNSNKEIVMIALRVRDVYFLYMTSSAQEFCFFAKASENLNWLWHKRLAHLNFKTINKLAKQNLVIGLSSLVYSKDKPCSSCEREKHHRVSFKTKQTSSIKK
ncbi:retrovirus-related pol polyprotein from transposon TNT 1-94 [Tanacetum coccineum]